MSARIAKLREGDLKTIATCITLVENELPGYEELLRALPPGRNTRVVGLTGPPGAGKSTLVNALLQISTQHQMKVAVLSVDPSSPFHQGALLGDRIRMPAFYMHPDVYIRSLGSRGNLGGLSAHIIEVLEIIQQAPFDLILLETVGVGQSEVEIAGLADITVVVFVPEAGDDIQTMKAGLMEVADVFVVNKADRARADELVRHLQGLVHERGMDASTPVLKCVATEGEGVEALYDVLLQPDIQKQSEENRIKHLAEKAWQLIQHRRMKDISKTGLQQQIKTAIQQDAFNLYRFVSAYNP